ncbi:MAG: hypothetical protein A2017_16965 [Lentisphaerae bacterium GWF2_44_16]|nr:MAG: hypothetical protein A2017_16965 [Lentisphaerae bacterium GWF2_44_16]
MRMKTILFAFCNLMIIQQAYADSDLLMTSDKPFVISYPDTPLPVEKTAAEELSKYINLSTGARTEIINESKLQKKDAADAYIGQCNYTKGQDFYVNKFKQEGFNIAVNNGRLFIYGDDSKGDAFSQSTRTGTLFGVYDFLEKELGIAWIWPGKSGEDVPAVKELHIKSFSRIDFPKYCIRSVMINEGAELKYWLKKMKLSWVPGAWFGHSWDSYVFKTGMDKEHPEWLALRNGERRKPHCCTANKEFRDYMVDRCLNSPGNKGKSIVSISPSDGYGFCECEKCHALDPQGTDYKTSIPNLSNRHWDYANYIAREVKKKNPDLNIGMFAYTAYAKPPTNIDKFEDNLYISFTFSAGYFVKPEMKEDIYKRIDEWKSKGIKIVGREYWGMHYWLELPYVFTAQIKDSMPYLYKRGLVAMYGEAHSNFATQGPVYYLVAHMMWDPETNADKVMERYYKAFGPASEYIRNYYDTFEKAIIENQGKIESFAYLGLINSWPEIFPEKTIAKAGEFLKKAEDAVKGNPVYEERVKCIGIGYEYTKVMIELLAVYRKLGRAGVPLWCFGYQGALAEASHYKLAEMPEAWKEFWSKHPDEPLDKSEKIKLLKRALELGNAREKIIYGQDGLPAISKGMYEYTLKTGMRPWHRTVKEELAKEGIKAE